MPDSEAQLQRAIESATTGPFVSQVCRVHWREVDGRDWSLSLRTSGRYHCGLDLFPPDQVFAALYTSLAPEIAIWEMVRRSAARNLAYLQNNVLTEIEVSLDRVLDVLAPSSIGVTRQDLTGSDVSSCQRVAAIARSQGIEGLLVPSAALPGRNLVLFPDNLVNPSALRMGRSTALALDAIVGHDRQDTGSQEP